MLKQRRAERLERLRDDPYYIIDQEPVKSLRDDDDVESIPIVHLEDMPPLPKGNRLAPHCLTSFS
jgi:AP-3 complex subunit delta-1